MPDPRFRNGVDLVKAGEASRFKPGQSGYPGGAHAQRLEIWKKQVEAEFTRWADSYIRARDGDDVRLAVDATEKVFDRVFGKTPQPITIAPLITDAPGGMLDVVE